MWRGPEAEPAPGPWPGRVDAFLTACAIFAGEREKDVLTALQGLGEAMEKVGQQAGVPPRGP